MDGQAHDYVINEQGELVAVASEPSDLQAETGLQAVAVITQEPSGAMALQVFGSPSQELLDVLSTVRVLTGN